MLKKLGLMTRWEKARKVRQRKFVQDFMQSSLVSERPEKTLQNPSNIEDLFWNTKGTVIHKWLHYLPLYERYFSSFAQKPVKVLEIGVSKGGSLSLWRRYFNENATIFGIDIDQNCKKYDGADGQVRIGSQCDPEFLKQVVAEMGGIDIVIDDGSHNSPDIQKSFEVLFPLLADGGVYLIEDLHAAYWLQFEGGYNSRTSFMNSVKQMIDDMHHWYHEKGEKITAAAGQVAGLHIHDSIVVVEKQKTTAPCRAIVGAAT